MNPPPPPPLAPTSRLLAPIQPVVDLCNRPYLVGTVPHLPGYYRLEEFPQSTQSATTSSGENNQRNLPSVRPGVGMSEPRVRLTRHQGQLNFGNELRQMLYAYGDTSPHSSFPQEPNSETVRVLDEIVTDFIIETCHESAQVANYAGRQKVKVDDFRFILRRDPVKLGRVQELFRLERELKEARKAFDQNDDRVGGGLKETAKTELEEMADAAGLNDDETATAKEPGASGKKGKGKVKPKPAGKRIAADRKSTDSATGKRRKLDTTNDFTT